MMKALLRHAALIVAALGTLTVFHGAASAQTNIVDGWSKVTPPPAPALKPASLDGKTTALLVMDFVKQSCNEKSRPSCVASIPKVKAMIDAATAKGVMVVWTSIRGPKPEDYISDVAPRQGSSLLIGAVDKFTGTDLEKMLKDKGITTVITTGTSSYGVVIFTATEATVRGFNVVVPVDGMSSSQPFGDQATAWILANLPGAADKVTLTRSDMVTYK
jgi:nicotinamidase-related amidase